MDTTFAHATLAGTTETAGLGARWLRRLVLMTLGLVALQPISAGFFMSGYGPAVAVPSFVGLALLLGVPIQAVTAIVWWRRSGLLGRAAVSGVVLFVMVVLEVRLGFSRVYWLHVPIGVGLFGGYAYPDAEPEQLQALCDFLAVWLMLDDHLEFALPMLELDERASACSIYMEALDSGRAVHSDGLARCLADSGQRIKAMSVTPTWYRFLNSMVDYFEGVLAEVAAHEVDHVVGRRRYLGFRAHAAGANAARTRTGAEVSR